MNAPGGSDGHNGQPKRRGRPPSAPMQRRDQNITFRTSSEIKDKLEQAAAQSGRTVSQEIEFWLKICLNEDRLNERGEDSFIESIISDACKSRIRSTEKRVDELSQKAADIYNKTREDLGNKTYVEWVEEIRNNNIRLDNMEKLIKDLKDQVRIAASKTNP